MTTATQNKPLETQNKEWGFFGTIARETDETTAARAFEQASRAIAETLSAYDDGHEGIRDFLDARDGRHFADSILDQMNRGENFRTALARTIAQYQSWTIGPRTERETGIPRGLPYLTGWTTHYQIEADMMLDA